MSQITFADEMIEIDATLVAKGLGMHPDALRQAMREGHVTRTMEKGEGAHAGRFRATFYSPNCRLRLLFNDEGIILQTSSAEFSRKPRAASTTVVSP